MKPFTLVVLASAFLAVSTPLLARPQQDGQESVADAARKAQAAKKANPQPAKVITNDDLSEIKGSISVVGEEPAPPAEAPTTAAPAAPGKGEGYWRQAFADARRKLADDEHELDILQREYNLKQQQYYSDPNTALREQYDRKDLTDTKTAIDDKTAAVAADKQKISDLEDALRQDGGDPGWEEAAPESDSGSQTESQSDTQAQPQTQAPSQGVGVAPSAPSSSAPSTPAPSATPQQ